LLHASNSGQCSWYDLAVAIQKTAVEQGVLQQPVAITPVSTDAYSAGKTLAPRPAYSALDNRLLSRYLFQTPQSWQQALARCVAGLHTATDKHSRDDCWLPAPPGLLAPSLWSTGSSSIRRILFWRRMR